MWSIAAIWKCGQNYPGGVRFSKCSDDTRKSKSRFHLLKNDHHVQCTEMSLYQCQFTLAQVPNREKEHALATWRVVISVPIQ